MSLVKNLIRDYGDDFKIEIPHWEIPDQGITALWGPSGAGKTSVFRLLIGLEPCPGLQWHFQGEDLAQLPVPQKKLGVVFQSLELFPHMTALENIRFAAQARKVNEADQKISALARDLNIDAILQRSVEVLSGGERQRVALARALIGEPRFLFLDEPFSALDAELRSEARELVKKVVKEQYQIPTLLITHDPEDLKILADRVVKIKNGKLVS